MTSTHPAVTVSIEYDQRREQSSPIVQYDGGSVKAFCAKEVERPDTITIGSILRFNVQTSKLTAQNIHSRPVGVVVVWDNQTELGAYQYDGVLTIRLSAEIDPQLLQPWSPWNCNHSYYYDSDATYPEVGWVISTKASFARIQIDTK